jgi:Spore coat polysaccharide biosynthesis protein F, CMP-KDO synthetase homolog
MKAVITIPARMTSSRFPGKVMADVGPDSALGFLITRLSPVAPVVVVTSADPSDAPIVETAKSHGAQVVLGKHGDMIRQHYLVARDTDADVFLMAGADDPLLDPALFRVLIDRMAIDDVDYAKTAGWPLGLNVWAWTDRAIAEAYNESRTPEERQHVVPFWERRPDRFPQAVIARTRSVYDLYRVTVDEGPDMQLVRTLISMLPEGFGAEDVIDALERHPELCLINASGLRGTAARDAIYDVTPIRTEAVA